MKNIHFCTLDQFYAAPEQFRIFNDHASSSIAPIQGQWKNIYLSLSYSNLRQKPQSNHWKTQKLTTPYVQLFRILWQSIINILRPGQNQLLLLFFNIFYSNATSHQPNVVLEVLATWMTRTFHPNVVTSPKQHWNWGIGLTTFVTDWQ